MSDAIEEAAKEYAEKEIVDDWPDGYPPNGYLENIYSQRRSLSTGFIAGVKSTQIDKDKHVGMVLSLLKKGDLITHTRCMGCIEEHYYTGMDGHWICGIASADTMTLSTIDTEGRANDISPLNVTHINRVLVENIEFLDGFKREK